MYKKLHCKFFFYFLFITGYSIAQCDVTVSADQKICKGTEVTLSASSLAGDGVKWKWLDNFGVSYSEQDSITVIPDVTTTYSVTAMYSSAEGSELVTNGNFEQGNVGFSTDYTPGVAGAKPYGPLGPEATYIVSNDAKKGHTSFIGARDHTTGAGNYMVVNGSADIIAKPNIWYQEITGGIKPYYD